MPAAIRRQRLPNTVENLNPEVVILSDGFGGEAVIWPALGFNCIGWTCDWQGRQLNLVHQDPALFTHPSPTRSGNPVLFPFPNRIRHGKYDWAGHTYSLPINHGDTSIHGFACRAPWRVVSEGVAEGEAWVTGDYHGFVDNPSTSEQWPADHILRLTCRLNRGRLGFEAEILNPDPITLPWGLGYHPYFRSNWHADFANSPLEIRVQATSSWELENCLPTGKVRPVDKSKDLSQWHSLTDLNLDDVLTGLANQPDNDGMLVECGALRYPGGPTLRVLADPVFRHVVVFTPADRASVCIEPYTCVTDAINLEACGKCEMPSGLIESPPGGHFRAEMAWEIS